MEYHLAQIVFVWKIPLTVIGEVSSGISSALWAVFTFFERWDIFGANVILFKQKNPILYF